MKFFWLRLYPEQPLQLDNPAIINGRTLRGAVAAILLRGCEPGNLHDDGPCSSTCAFWPVFGVQTPIRFGNAYATPGDETAPFLTTTRTCSVRPGFAANGQHGVFDTLVRAWTFEGSLGTPLGMLAPFETCCPVCGADLQACTGFLVRHGDRHFAEAGDITTPITTEQRPIGRSRRNGLELFEQRGVLLSHPACYVASLTVPEPLEGALRSVLNVGLAIGRRRTRGMGLVRAELIARIDPTRTLSERIATFNRALRTERRFYATMGVEQPLDDGSWYLTLDFPTGILFSSMRQLSLLSEVRALRGVQIIRQWITSGLSTGRNTATGMPIRTQTSLAGVILCRVQPDADRAALEQALMYLETHGMGADRDRGHGDVTVCDPFHLEMDVL